MKGKFVVVEVHGTLPDDTNISISYNFTQLPRKGHLLEVASLLPQDEQLDYRKKLKFDNSKEARRHHFVEVKEIIWATSESPFSDGHLNDIAPHSIRSYLSNRWSGFEGGKASGRAYGFLH